MINKEKGMHQTITDYNQQKLVKPKFQVDRGSSLQSLAGFQRVQRHPLQMKTTDRFRVPYYNDQAATNLKNRFHAANKTSSQNIRDDASSTVIKMPSNLDTKEPTMFENERGIYSNRSSKLTKGNVYKNYGQFQSHKNLSR